jgi:hypothetical protein
MKRPTDDQILTALCCGPKCKAGPNTGCCHRWDFTTELTRVRALLDNMENGHDRDQDRSRGSEVEEQREARVATNKKLIDKTTRARAKGIGKVVNIKTVKARALLGRSGRGQMRGRAVEAHKRTKQAQ